MLLDEGLSDGGLIKRAGVVAGEKMQSCVSVTADTSGFDRWGLFIYWGGQRQEVTGSDIFMVIQRGGPMGSGVTFAKK